MVNKGILLLLLCFSVFIKAMSQPSVVPKGMKEETVDPVEMKAWTILGQGESFLWGNQLGLKETPGSKGVMLLSPKHYRKEVVVKFKALALTPATVFVVILSALDRGKDSLIIPAGYDGAMNLWEQGQNYFFAFKNAPHGSTPYIKKNYSPIKEAMAAEQDHMNTGTYHDIEIGCMSNQLWCRIDGKLMVEMKEEQLLPGGHLALRLRGLPGFEAACLIKDLVIQSK